MSEVAWAAGLFEGEGSFGVTAGRGDQCALVASMAMVDEDVMCRFHEVVGVGFLISTERTKNGKQVFRWGTKNMLEALHVADLLGPWLGERRRLQVRAAIARRLAFEAENPKRRTPIATKWKENR